MTIFQIQAFLEVARCKNISDAAKHLFMTQPALGRQLTAMEQELNMQLMIRNNRGVKLTPAGIALKESFEKLMVSYKEGVEAAEKASYGFSTTLSIGVLEELRVADLISHLIDYFEQNYPNIDIHIRRMSFGALLDGLYNDSLDAVISLDVNFLGSSELSIMNLRSYIPAFAVPVGHPLASAEQLNYKDFLDVPIAIVDKDDCAEGVKKIEDLFKQYGGFYPKLYFTTSMKDAVSWVEAGKKCAVLNMEMRITDSKRVKMYPIAAEGTYYVQLATKAGNDNQAVRLLLDYYSKADKNHMLDV